MAVGRVYRAPTGQRALRLPAVQDQSTIRPARILRIIARLNVGGPAHHVSILSGRLDRARFETLLVAGRLGPSEGSMEDLVEHHGARMERIEALGPDLDAVADARALRALVATMRRFRPDLVHTHTAKAGTLGRLAARIAFPRRPAIVHTYHGHVLSGYFGPRKEAAFRQVERELARISDRLIGASNATVDELVQMRIAPREHFRVIPTGLDLEPFLALDGARDPAFRAEVGATDEELLVVFVARLVPIKRVDVLLDAVAHARATGAPLRLAVVGDGELRGALEEQARRLDLTTSVTFVGFRRDLPSIVAGADMAVLSSDNEATPVALIEAAAGGRPAIATDVGGVSDVVDPGSLAAAGDSRALGDLLARAALDRSDLRRLGLEARERVRHAYGFPRLLRDIEALYDDVLAQRRRS